MFELITASLSNILYVFFAFSLVIFIHEFGHFYIGKKCGIGINEFSIGFGPKLFWFKDSSGVLWKFCILPFGGFVKFAGDLDPSSLSQLKEHSINNSKHFNNATIMSRALTVFAGPAANILLSLFLFSSIIMINGIANEEPLIGKINNTPFQDIKLKKGDLVLEINNKSVENFSDIIIQYNKMNDKRDVDFLIKRQEETLKFTVPNLFQPLIKSIEPLSPASKAGLLPGDFILKVNGINILAFNDLKRFVNNSNGDPLALDIFRNGTMLKRYLSPEKRPIENPDGSFGETLRIGIIGGFALEPERISPNLFKAIEFGFSTTFRVISGSVRGLLEIINGSISAKHVSGPIGIAHAISDVSKNGFISFISLLGLISTGIAIINLFPLPILDGGHLLLLLYEKIFSKKPSALFMQFFTFIGVFLLLSLMIFATYNDLLRIIL
ncbi:MAG: RIP metalloprotease RseP [Paracoccaceae bacterium]